jgi:hypothetical protein
MDAIRAAIQAWIDRQGDGYTVSHFWIAVGLERIDSDGVAWGTYAIEPDSQPSYVTDGLIDAVLNDRRAPVSD